MKFLKEVLFKGRKIIVILAALTLFPLQLSATTLVGDEIQASLSFSPNPSNPDTISPSSTIVGSGVEFTINSSFGTKLFTIDIGDNFIKIAIASSITMTSGFSKKLNLTNIDWFGDPSLTIKSVSLETGKDVSYFPNPTGIDMSDITFSDHSLTFEYGGNDYWARTSWAKITLTPSDPPSNVPEPATIFLFGLGLLGVAGVSRRKK